MPCLLCDHTAFSTEKTTKICCYKADQGCLFRGLKVRGVLLFRLSFKCSSCIRKLGTESQYKNLRMGLKKLYTLRIHSTYTLCKNVLYRGSFYSLI